MSARARRAGAIPRSRSPVTPGQWLGLLGGGQLGRMFCMAAQQLGYRVAVLDPGRDGPAGRVADRQICADYLDPKGLATLRRLCRAATTEFENVPAAALEFLAQDLRVTPGAPSVAIAQDRISEKSFLSGRGFALAPYALLRDDADVAALNAVSLLPGIVKRARLGYDGKGQIAVAGRGEVAAAFAAMGKLPCVLEKRIELACELSVVVARGDGGDVSAWPVTENRHRDGILDVSIAPARVDSRLAHHARECAVAVAAALDYVGVLCVEMFVTADAALLINEIAPRPHNSGHYTIDACVSSQFEQQARILAGLPQGETQQHTPAVMVNLLGDVWFAGASSGTPREPDWTRVLGHSRAKLHLYGKREPRRGRKMGHVTCLGDTIEAALDSARAIKRELGIPEAGIA